MLVSSSQPSELRDLMWKFVLPPVLAVSAVWIVMSTSTSLYVYWIEASHQRVFDENVSSIRAAVALQEKAHRIAFAWPTDEESQAAFTQLWPTRLRELEDRERTLQQTIHTPEERERMISLTSCLAQLKEFGTRSAASVGRDAAAGGVVDVPASIASVRELLSQTDTASWDLISVNQDLVLEASERRSRISYGVLWMRLVLLISGPAWGLWMGWRLARRLQHSVAKIAVTLKQTDQTDVPLGTVTVQSSGVLQDVQQQAEEIVARLRESHRGLEQANHEVVRSERLAAVGQLAAGVAHELRNPLTSVKLLLQHAAQSPSPAGVSGSKLQLILEEIGRMEATIQGLLDFSRQQPLRRSLHDLKEPLQRALNLLDGRARQAGVRIEVELPPEPLTVDGDPELLHQVFVNLGLNAIDAMPDGGVWRVKADPSTQPRRLRVVFEDNGPGIPAAVLPHVFEPFTTTKERGTGLGLAVSRRIVDQHGGLLLAANRAAGGAILSLELPLTDRSTSAEPPPTTTAMGDDRLNDGTKYGHDSHHR